MDYEDSTKMSDLLNFLDYKHFGLSGAKDLEMLKYNNLIITYKQNLVNNDM